MIPLIIHQIWLGEKRMPIEWMDTWKQDPSIEYHLWREHQIDMLCLENRDKYDYFINKKDYAGAADVARVEILHRFGGFYVDADAICINSIKELFDYEFVAGIEYDRRIANGMIGSIAKHPILTDYKERIKEATIIDPPCYTIGGTMLTSCIDNFGRDRVTILPQHAFYPKIKKKGEYKKNKSKIYCKQMFASTRNLYE